MHIPQISQYDKGLPVIDTVSVSKQHVKDLGRMSARDQ